ncbi:hypothetical protein ACFUMH_04090 [Cellulomonas sp. NPDC057328]|uniref:hypothetical protein n=1 Tax=Cellulomonas sp. NPDC057328 TaxID=3346101 RepID=UPI0036415FE5
MEKNRALRAVEPPEDEWPPEEVWAAESDEYDGYDPAGHYRSPDEEPITVKRHLSLVRDDDLDDADLPRLNLEHVVELPASNDPYAQWHAYWTTLWGCFDYGNTPAYVGLSRNPFPGDGHFGLVGCYDVRDPDAIWDAIQGEERWVKAVHINVGLLSHRIDRGRGKAEDVGWLTGFWVDVDIADSGAHAETNDHRPHPTEAQARALIDSAAWEPGLVVTSGYGLHVYFLFDRPMDAQAPETADLLQRWDAYWTNMFHSANVRTDWEDTEKGTSGTVQGFHIDKGVQKDMARVLRPAGAFNRKDRNNPRPVRIVSMSGKRYSAEDFAKALPTMDAQRSERGVNSRTALTRAGERKAAVGDRVGDRFAMTDGALDAMLSLHRCAPHEYEADRWVYARPDGSFGDESHAVVHHDPDGVDRIWPATGTRMQADWMDGEEHTWSAWDILGNLDCGGDWHLAARVVRAFRNDDGFDLDALCETLADATPETLAEQFPEQRPAGLTSGEDIGKAFASLPCDDVRGYALRWALIEGPRFLWSSTSEAVDVTDVVWRGWNGQVWHKEARSGPTGLQASLNRIATLIEEEESPVREWEAGNKAAEAAAARGESEKEVAEARADARAATRKYMRAYASALTRTSGYRDAIAQITALSSAEKERLARIDPSIHPDRRVRPEVWNANPALLALEGDLGVVDLRTGEIRDYDPTDRITAAVAAPFDGRDKWLAVMRAGLDAIAKGKPLTWPRYMQEMFDRWDRSTAGLAEHLQRCAGTAVWGDQVGLIILLHSPEATGTGKSTVFNALARALGSELACDTTLEVFGSTNDPAAPNPAKARLVGKRFWWSDDSRSAGEGERVSRRSTPGLQVDTGEIKRLTTNGARLTGARMLHQPEEEEPVRGTLIASSQHYVAFTETDVALLRRLVVILFSPAAQIPVEQLDDDKGALWLTPEGQAWVLLWAIEGCVKSRREHARRKAEAGDEGVSFVDCLAAPPEAAEWKAAYGEKINEASEFWNACFIPGTDDDTVTPREIEKAYEDWYMDRWRLDGAPDRYKPNAPRMLSDQRLLMLCGQLISAMGGHKVRPYILDADGKRTGQKATVYKGVRAMRETEKADRAEQARRAERPCTVKQEDGRVVRSTCSVPDCNENCGLGVHSVERQRHLCVAHENVEKKRGGDVAAAGSRPRGTASKHLARRRGGEPEPSDDEF